MLRLTVLGVVLLFGSSCLSCAGVARARAWGSNGHITCYSGEKVIYEGDSMGQIESESNSDGYHFMDAKTNRLVRVSGNCVITN
jgi:hypothetical protein